MVYQNEKQIFDGKNILQEAGKIQIKNPELFRKKIVDDIVDTLILSEDRHLKKNMLLVSLRGSYTAGSNSFFDTRLI